MMRYCEPCYGKGWFHLSAIHYDRCVCCRGYGWHENADCQHDETDR